MLHATEAGGCTRATMGTDVPFSPTEPQAAHMFIIKSGRLQVSFNGKDGKKHTISERGPGECCGENSCLSKTPRNTTLECISKEGCEVSCVCRDDVLQLVKGSWDVARDLARISNRHDREKQRHDVQN